MNARDARRTVRIELAEHAARRAEDAERTASNNARDVEGARDALRIAAAYRAEASRLDPIAYPPPERPTTPPPGLISLVTPDGTPIEEMAHG